HIWRYARFWPTPANAGFTGRRAGAAPLLSEFFTSLKFTARREHATT
ncbi:MAG: hypothetical protein H6Q33_5567, partial [Deltaproteobacteria bacterium]|nr:hypothetical protein [Deltaproteobacteria bacterium]